MNNIPEDVFIRHPLPWRLADGYPAQGFAPDDIIAVDANGNEILGCSEWFTAQPGVLEAMLEAINLFAETSTPGEAP